MAGAVDFDECPYPAGRCKCEKCGRCGFWKHMSVHGPCYGQPAGSRPWDHEFSPVRKRERQTWHRTHATRATESEW